MLTLLFADTETESMRTMHLVLLNLKHSLVNENKQLRVIVHTKKNEYFELDMKGEVPFEYHDFDNRFDAVKKVKGTFEECLKSLTPACKIIAMSPEGKQKDLEDVFHDCKGGNTIVIIGGFEHGDYNSNVYELANQVVSLGESLLKVWTVVNEVVVHYERATREE